MSYVDVKYYSKDKDRFICEVCPVSCKLREGQVGLCKGRRVFNNKLLASNYGEVVSIHFDPIEKKPLYHIAPGKPICSIGPNGCNLLCKWCQNYSISQETIPTRFYSPEKIATIAMQSNSVGIAYTYTEPLIWYEYIMDVAPLIHKSGGINVLVTNGYISRKPLMDLLPFIDAANVDLKFIDKELYKKYSGCDLDIIKENIQLMHEAGIHVEITHLMVSGLVDNEEHFSSLVNWLESLDIEIPLHISRYFPQYNWDYPPTSVTFMEKAYISAKQKLKNVYVGNVNIRNASDSFCTECSSLLVQRNAYNINITGLDQEGNCLNCGSRSKFRMI